MLTSFTGSLSIFSETMRSIQRARHPEADIPYLQSEWAQRILARANVNVECVGEVSSLAPLLFVGNHISYLDIPILLSLVPQIAFVSKHEISQWPIFGTGAKKMNTVFVKRESGGSRLLAREAIKNALIAKQRIALFPSGTTCLTEKKTWRRGAFEIAYEQEICIQPFRISYYPLRAAAYIDKDFFPVHLYKLFNTGRIDAHIEFHNPVRVSDPARDCEYWQNWTRQRGLEAP